MFNLLESRLLHLPLHPRRPGLDQLNDHLLADIGLLPADLRRAAKRRR